MTIPFHRIFCEFTEKTENLVVVLYTGAYEDIVNGKNHHQHKEVETHLDLVKKAIEDPDIVLQDSDYKNRRHYFVYFVGDEVYGEAYMKVVVEIPRFMSANVVTAYFLKNIKISEKPIWKKSN